MQKKKKKKKKKIPTFPIAHFVQKVCDTIHFFLALMKATEQTI